MPPFIKYGRFVVALLFGLGGLLAGCAPQPGGGTPHTLAMAPLSEMPADVQQAPAEVQAAYQFAVANPEVLAELPCYCGCSALGHKSNYACYVAGIDDAGQVTFDPHALGCTICVDITQDAMRLLGDGQSLSEIRAHVDQTYSRYGPSNMP